MIPFEIMFFHKIFQFNKFRILLKIEKICIHSFGRNKRIFGFKQKSKHKSQMNNP